MEFGYGVLDLGLGFYQFVYFLSFFFCVLFCVSFHIPKIEALLTTVRFSYVYLFVFPCVFSDLLVG